MKDKKARASAAAVEASVRKANVKRGRDEEERHPGNTLIDDDINLDDEDDEPSSKKMVTAATILKNLLVKFFSWLVKQKAINEDCEVLKQVEVDDEFVEKLHKLDVTDATLNDLENKFKVISTPSL